MNSRSSRSCSAPLLARCLVALTAALCACDSSSVPVRADGRADGSGDGAPACAEGTYLCAQTGTCAAVVKKCETDPQCIPGEEVDYGPGPYTDEQTCTPIPQTCVCKEKAPLNPGLIGRHAALAATGDRLVASAYDSTFGDLVLVSAPLADLASPSFESVDGVPETPPTAGRSGYRGGISEQGDDVGLHTAIATGSDGTLYIAYHDKTHRALKLARSTVEQGWQTHVVAAPADDRELVGRYTALQLVDGKPAVAFLVLNKDAGDGKRASVLSWAQATTEQPAALADWAITTVESAPMPCRNLCDTGSACFLAPDGSSRCQPVDTGCAKCTADQACRAGVCAAILPDSTVEDVPRASGLWPAVAIVKQGPLLVYHDSIAGQLKVALLGGGEWVRRTVQVDAGTDAFGAFCSVAADDSGIAHIAHQNATRELLSYVQIDPAAITAGATPITPKASETIDDGARPDGQHPVGADSAIAVAPSGAIRVIYQDQLDADLLTAERKGTNAWTPKDLNDPDLGRTLKAGDSGYGFYSALTAQGGKLYGVTFAFDTQSARGGGLEFFALP